MIISIDTEISLTKSKTHLMIKTLYKLGRNRVMISFHLLSLYASQLFYKFQTPWYFKQSSSWWGIHSDLHYSQSCSHTRGSCPSACIASYNSSHTSPSSPTFPDIHTHAVDDYDPSSSWNIHFKSHFWGGGVLAMCHMRSQFPYQGLNPCSLQWKHGVLTPGPPGKSFKSHILKESFLTHPRLTEVPLFDSITFIAHPDQACYAYFLSVSPSIL